MSNKIYKTKLSNIATVLQGQSPESMYYSNSDGVPFLQGNRNFGNIYPTFDTFTKKVTKTAKKGEVLISVRAPVGDLNIAPCDLCIGRGLASIKSKNGNNRFIYYALKYNIYNLMKQGAATTFDSVSKDIINDLELIIPEDELNRNKIATVLSSLDAKIELNNKINAELEQMAKTLYDYWFMQFDFPDENGKPYKSSGGKMVWNEELKREIPEGWGVKRIGEVATVKAGGDKPALISLDKTNEYPIPIFSNGIINDGLYGYTNKAIINSQSVTISARGTIGFCVLRNKPFVPIIRLISLTPDCNGNARYFYEALKNFNFENSGSVQQQLTVPQVQGIKILYPIKDILKRFDSITFPMINKMEIIAEENQQLSALRDWLLPMLMNGQVRVE